MHRENSRVLARIYPGTFSLFPAAQGFAPLVKISARRTVSGAMGFQRDTSLWWGCGGKAPASICPTTCQQRNKSFLRGCGVGVPRSEQKRALGVPGGIFFSKKFPCAIQPTKCPYTQKRNLHRFLFICYSVAPRKDYSASDSAVVSSAPSFTSASGAVVSSPSTTSETGTFTVGS